MCSLQIVFQHLPKYFVQVSYVRRVLQVIPESVVQLLDKIVKIQTDVLQEVPTR